MKKLKKWYESHKDEPLFTAKLLLAVLIILVIITQIFNPQTPKETEKGNSPPSVSEESGDEETPEDDMLTTVWENSKAHIVAFVGVTGTLAVVKVRQNQKLKESR